MRKASAIMTTMACGAIIMVGYQAGVANAPIVMPTTSQAAAIPTTAATTVPTNTTAPSASATPTASTPPVATATPTVAPTASASPSPTATVAPVPVVPVTTPVTLTGDAVNTRYGTVQVSVTYTGSTITDVTALKLTDQDSRSVQISNRAAPVLRSEVLSAQSASVSNVSGATYTTEGYLTSLQSAIDKHV